MLLFAKIEMKLDFKFFVFCDKNPIILSLSLAKHIELETYPDSYRDKT